MGTYTERSKEYRLAYARDKLHRIPLDYRIADYEAVKAAAAAAGESLTAYCKAAIAQRMERDSATQTD